MAYNLRNKDKELIWHPYTPYKKDSFNIPIIKAEGAFLFDENGKKYIDAISSWWVNIHGHAHPYLAEKIYEQFKTLEHVIFAGFTHPQAIELSRRILEILPGNYSKVFFSDNGSTAVEVALKMAFQFFSNQGIEKTKILALRGAYHGDTFGAMSVSDRSVFTKAFDNLLFEVDFIDLPNAHNLETSFQFIDANKDQYAAFIFEPLVQGAAGMKIYEAQYLEKLIQHCKSNSILCIADEVMTGFGRTGKLFAMEYLNETADICCLSKGLTGGSMPLGLTTCTNTVFEKFESDNKMHTLYHGHSFTGNPLACAVSNASLDLLLEDKCLKKIQEISRKHQKFVLKFKDSKKIKNINSLGTILSIEFEVLGEESNYFNSIRETIYSFFIENGILIRPLGNSIYLIPPYCIEDNSLEYLYLKIEEYIHRHK